MIEDDNLYLAVQYANRMVDQTGDYEYSIKDTAAEFEIHPDVIQRYMNFWSKEA